MTDEFKRISALDEWRQAVLCRAAQAIGAAFSRGEVVAAFQVFVDGVSMNLQASVSVHAVTSLFVLCVVEQTSGRFVCRSNPVEIDSLRQDEHPEWWIPHIDDQRGASSVNGV